MDNGAKDMLDALYKDNQLADNQCLPDMDVTLGIDTSGMEKTHSKFSWKVIVLEVKKTMSEEE